MAFNSRLRSVTATLHLPVVLTFVFSSLSRIRENFFGSREPRLVSSIRDIHFQRHGSGQKSRSLDTVIARLQLSFVYRCLRKLRNKCPLDPTRRKQLLNVGSCRLIGYRRRTRCLKRDRFSGVRARFALHDRNQL